MKSLPVFLLALGLTACATSTSPDEAALRQSQARVAPTDAARLGDATARELSHLARFDPDVLETVYPELRALAAALVGASAAAEAGEPVTLPDMAMNTGTDTVPPVPEPMPQPARGSSLLHAVHLASYRREDMAERGWQELQTSHPVLAGLDARLELAHIPDQGDFLRLKAGPFDNAAEARTVCAELEARGQYCRATDFTGRDFGPGANAHE
ncbi:SPOR domain-containing protein [Maricaulis parjimensis]|uniref:SPOR domain-containing protein n=1 Tax=Maricaulis parjimensis TaxID=144023 RepID=UPI00193ADA81|nr:SPOR domain-containing protein [Maricaulis parjimensis]